MSAGASTSVQAGAWIAAAARRLAAASDVERPPAEARALLARAMDETPERLFAYPETPVAAPALAEALLLRRLGGEPLSRVLGEREFWSLTFEITPDVLDPRPDTETLVETALDIWPDVAPRRVLDLGVGSGCILLSLLNEWPTAAGVGVDRSRAAATQARRNAEKLGLADRACFVVGDWTEALAAGGFDLVVSNPPYVATKDGPTPDAATAHFDPPDALWAGADGLSAYRAIFTDVARTLSASVTGRPARLLLEIGVGQADPVSALADAAGFRLLKTATDIAGRGRCMVFALDCGPAGSENRREP